MCRLPAPFRLHMRAQTKRTINPFNSRTYFDFGVRLWAVSGPTGAKKKRKNYALQPCCAVEAARQCAGQARSAQQRAGVIPVLVGPALPGKPTARCGSCCLPLPLVQFHKMQQDLAEAGERILELREGMVAAGEVHSKQVSASVERLPRVFS